MPLPDFRVAIVDAAGTDSVSQPVAGPAASGATASGNPVPQGGDFNTTLPTVTNGQRVTAQYTARGIARQLMHATSVTAGDGVSNGNLLTVATESGLATVPLPVLMASYDFNGTTWDRHRKPNGVARLISAAGTTNATAGKTSAGDLWTATGYNAAATVRYLKIYNKASAPTVGTDTPVLTIALKPTDAFNLQFCGQYFATGISFAFTTGSADADTGALTAADIVGFALTYA